MTDSNLKNLLDRAVIKHGESRVEQALLELTSKSEAPAVLTIIGNRGVHVIDTSAVKGDLFYASTGSWDDTSAALLLLSFDTILRGVAAKLNERPWKKVYLLPTGHPVLNMNIKALVYRILRINTIDLYYTGSEYIELSLDLRDIAQTTPNSE